MKKIFILLIVATTFTYTNLIAQEMAVGTNFLSLGVGPSNSYYNFHTVGTPAIRLAFDHGFKKAGPGVISLGGSIGAFTKLYKSYNYNQGTRYDYTLHWTYIAATFRVGYYYNFGKLIKAPELNAYAGVGAGILQSFYNYNGPYGDNFSYNNESDFQPELYFGANYFFSKKFALYTEFGYDISYVTLGMTFKL